MSTVEQLKGRIFEIAKTLQAAESMDQLVFDQELLEQFAADQQTATLYITKTDNQFYITNTPLAGDSSTLLIKNGPLDVSSLQVHNVSANMETLMSLVQYGVGSYFDVINTEKSDSVVAARRKINELALSLRHLQQQVQVPNLALTLHPDIKSAIEKGANEKNYGEFLDLDALDSSFLNSLQNIVNGWIKAVHSVTQLEHRVDQGSAADEINFWLSMEHALRSIEDQMNAKEVSITLGILTHAKRFHTTVGFVSDSGVKDCLVTARDYTQLMSDFPMTQLKTAESFPKLEEALELIVSQMKKIRLTLYPVARAVLFVEAISKDVDAKIKSLLDHDLMNVEFDKFEQQLKSCMHIYSLWDDHLKQIVTLFRELARKRSERVLIKINSHTEAFRKLLNYLLEFRQKHQELLRLLKRSQLDIGPAEYAYESVRHGSIATKEQWDSLEKVYNQRSQSLEDDIIAILSNQLSKSQSSNEMFLVFEQFQSLLARPRIQSAVREYQTQLLNIVRQDLAKIQQDFAKQDDITELSSLRDIPPVASKIIWAKQVENKIEFYVNRLNTILGDWSHDDGIHKEAMVLKSKVNVDKLFNDWTESVDELNLSGSVFKLVLDDNKIKLVVNFDPEMATLFKEVRNLSWQGFLIPPNIVKQSRLVRKVYPYVISLGELFFTLSNIFDKLDGYVKILLQDNISSMLTLLDRSMSSTWESVASAVDMSTDDMLCNVPIVHLEVAMTEFIAAYEQLAAYSTSLSDIFRDFSLDSINKIQSIVNSISLQGFQNMDVFVNSLNNEIGNKLVQYISLQLEGDLPVQEHSIYVQEQSILIKPEIENIRTVWMFYLAEIMDMLSINKIVDQQIQTESVSKDFKYLLPQLQESLNKAYRKIETYFKNATLYLDKWIRLEYLWLLSDEDIYATSLEEWVELLTSFLAERSVFDTVETSVTIEAIKFHFEQAQIRIGGIYDSWQRILMNKMYEVLYEQVKACQGHIISTRSDLENSMIDLSSTTRLVKVISAINNVNGFVEDLRSKLQLFKTCQRLLQKQRFNFGREFVYYDQLEADMNSMLEILQKKSTAVEDQRDLIASRLEGETRRVSALIVSLQSSWSEKKPKSGKLSPANALATLHAFQESVEQVFEDQKMIEAAGKMLRVPITFEESIVSVQEEITDYQIVWSSINTCWESLQQLKVQIWQNISFIELSSKLNEISTDAQNLPSRVRQYMAYDSLIDDINDIRDVLPVLADLKNESMKKRHWEQLFGKKVNMDSMTLSDVLSLQLLLNKAVVMEVYHKALGEQIVDTSLNEIKERWSTLTFTLFDRGDVQLVKSWEFQACTDDLNLLSSMHNSPFFDSFQDEITTLEKKIGFVYNVLDVWVDVQRHWVYLDGVFVPDMSSLLPQEFSRFKHITHDFKRFLSTVYKSMLLQDLSPDTLGQLSLLQSSLNKVRAALSDFLERQREKFPRFYFIGNEDLLEIIGGDIVTVSKHLKKMFTGVNNVVIKDNHVIGVVSIEGEELMLKESVECSMRSWLSELEVSIRETIKFQFLQALDALKVNSLDIIIGDFSFQALLLACQVFWTSLIENNRAEALTYLDSTLVKLSSSVATSPLLRKKTEGLIIELTHQQSVTKALLEGKTQWSIQQRFYFEHEVVSITQANVSFEYGFEYIGVPERLIYTPLMNRCFIAMTQALGQKLGGSPFGPAGTGKTESVKALAQNLGRMCLVFNCDESFDFQAMGRLFLGLSQVGAWGCFDEFNRLPTKILSAVSSQIETIEHAMLRGQKSVTLLNKTCPLHDNTGIFITMNPTYAGRSQLPENLKKLFREFSMKKPDSVIIAEVILSTLGIESSLGRSLVLLFEELKESVSPKPYYDFGLRALKSVLRNCGHLKHQDSLSSSELLLRSLHEMLLPKMTSEDENIARVLISKYFSGVEYILSAEAEKLAEALKKDKTVSVSQSWLKKILQLFQVQVTQQGIILVGESGSGKTFIWQSLLDALQITNRFVIDTKVLSKDDIFGTMDPITLEWKDGLFTKILREIIEDAKEIYHNPVWIVFDSDLDPDYVENLNSVLDDNKLLSLPNGERLIIPSNVRILFETDSLEHVTPATISRCGMVLLDDTTFDLPDIIPKETYSSVVEYASKLEHIMAWNPRDKLLHLSSLLECIENVTPEVLNVAITWCFAGDCSLEQKQEFAKMMNTSLDIGFDSSPWWIPTVDLDAHQVMSPDTIVPTIDTVRHEDLIFRFLQQRQPLILCGPPGSGKTMTLHGALSKSQDFNLVSINFSKESSTTTLLQLIEQHCEYKKTVNGLTLAPKNTNKWLVVFCDEINLPQQDNYGSQPVLLLIRQIIEKRGFWKNGTWCSVEQVQFVGACNPPTDPGRIPIPPRLLRHCAVVMVDYPGKQAMETIYTTFMRAVFVPDLRGFATTVAEASVQAYIEFKKQFTNHPHYVFSPRELTRWCRGLFHAKPDTIQTMASVWIHEGLRLFSDRLVTPEERKIASGILQTVFQEKFANLQYQELLFSDWLSPYSPVDMKSLKKFVKQRLVVFSEEVLEVDLFLYDDMIDHLLRIDRVLRQVQGHMILVGPSGSGKTTMAKFVSWMNGMTSIQLSIHRKYTIIDFDKTLKDISKRCCEGERICLILDESNIMEASFIERMNTLLANADIPGLLDEDELQSLYNNSGKLLDDIHSWFTQKISTNLHVVFTMSDLNNTSPALFNRCVVNWIGDWSEDTFLQISNARVNKMPVDKTVSDILTRIHTSTGTVPLKFLNFVSKFESIFNAKLKTLEEQERHVSTGLDTLKVTVFKVKQLNETLSAKKEILAAKQAEAKETLNHMLTQQNEAERKQEASIEIQQLLENQEREIQVRRAQVMADLAEAEPAVLEAQRGVASIKKQHLTEIRSMAHPPEAVKLTMEAVCILLGYEVNSWRDVQSIIRKDDFITSIVGYNTEQLTDEMRAYMELEYISRSNYEAVYRASKACGPLWLWIVAQLKYSEMLITIGPLREAMNKFEHDAALTKARLEATKEMIIELQETIESSKENYSLLIRDVESIKMEMTSVLEKVDRSTALVNSLTDERQRWSSKEFENERLVMCGDSILSAAYLTYCGSLDHKKRIQLRNLWNDFMSLPFSKVKATTTLQLENFGMLTEMSYIIDPSGDNLLALMSKFSNMVVTSFLDEGFIKILENTIRFGGHVMIQDAEFFDPIISKVISREVTRTGGRTLMKLGDREIDVSDFKLFLYSRSETITPFISSRMSIVNFAVSKDSLERSVMDLTLSIEKPEVEKQRNELTKLQGEYQTKLMLLEQDLLNTLSSGGDLLQDNNLMTMLETLKTDSKEISIKMMQGIEVMAQIENITTDYLPIVDHCCLVFDLLDRMSQLHPVYKFSLEEFSLVVASIFGHNHDVATLTLLFYQTIYATFSISMLEEDKLVFAVALCCFYKSCSAPKPEEYKEFVSVIMGGTPLEFTTPTLLVSDSDPSFRVSEMALKAGKKLNIVAMGSVESENTASALLETTEWVLLQNVHMSPVWLDTLHKATANFTGRLFMTCGLNSAIPSTLLRSCHKVLYDTVPGMKACVGELMQLCHDKKPVERKHLSFLVSWYHASLLERKRLEGLDCDFTYSDFQSCLFVLDSILPNKEHVVPQDIPWSEISFLISQIVYGKVEGHSFVTEFADQLFNRQSFDEITMGGLKLPTRDYTKWISELSDNSDPVWLGMPANAADELTKKTMQRITFKINELV